MHTELVINLKLQNELYDLCGSTKKMYDSHSSHDWPLVLDHMDYKDFFYTGPHIDNHTVLITKL